MKKLLVPLYVLTAFTFGGMEGLILHNKHLEEALDREKLLSKSYEEMLVMYYIHRDYEDLDSVGEPVRRFTFWEDAIMETDAYYVADSLRHGNWDNFDEESYYSK